MSYLGCDAPGSDRALVRAGVIAGYAEQDARTGKVLIPVRGPDDPPHAVSEWVPESSVFKLCAPTPRPSC